jgi:glycosyltransferase involved in cell wall biosynthesis
MRRIDVIAAVRDEEATLPRFVARVRALALPDDVELGFVFVEDSSRDGTLEGLRALAAADPMLGFYSLEEGFGQGPAIVYGLARSRAEAAILMDVDGSHPPEAIPQMIEAHLGGAGVVQCVRRTLRARRLHRRIGTALFQRLASAWVRVDLAEQAVYYRLVSRRHADRLVADPRTWRFLRFPLPREPGELATVEVDSVERETDRSKYGPLRLIGLAVDAVLSLMPRDRVRLALGLAAAVTVLAIALGAWGLALVVVAGTLLLARRHRRLRRADLLERMRAREWANVPPP